MKRCASFFPGNLLQRILMALLPVIAFSGCTSQGTPQEDKVIMTIFAHPDDEITVAPILSRYAREGAKIYAVCVTDGRYGQGFSGLPAGDELAAVRKEEFNCATEKLGAEPIWLGYHDQLRLREGYDGHVPLAQQLVRKVDSLITALQPDVLITWGPDGGSNHMDHRLVGATVTQVYARQSWEKPKALYFYASPAQLMDNEDSKLLRGVDEKYLTTQVAYTDEDLENAMQALYCYESQYQREQMESRREYLEHFTRKVYLRPFVGSQDKKSDLFE